MNKAKLKRLFSYGVVGVIVSTIYVLCTIFFTETIGFTPIIASALAYITSFMLSFFANHHIVFKSKENMSKTVIRFAVVSAFVFVFSTSIIYLTVEVFKIPYLYGVAVVLVLIPLSNYVLNLSWTFREVNKNEDIMYGSVLFTMRLYLFFKCIMHTFKPIKICSAYKRILVLVILFGLWFTFLWNAFGADRSFALFMDNEFFIGTVLSSMSVTLSNGSWPLRMDTIMGGIPLYNFLSCHLSILFI